MARYKRIPQKIGGYTALRAHRDFADICPACGCYILKGQLYVMKKREAWHFSCKEKAAQLPPESKQSAKVHTLADQRKLRKQRKEGQRERRQREAAYKAEYEEREQRLQEMRWEAEKARRREETARRRALGAQSKALADSDKGFDWAINKD
jgi:hypothetical protein